MRKAYRLDGGAKREIQGMRTSSGTSEAGSKRRSWTLSVAVVEYFVKAK